METLNDYLQARVGAELAGRFPATSYEVIKSILEGTTGSYRMEPLKLADKAPRKRQGQCLFGSGSCGYRSTGGSPPAVQDYQDMSGEDGLPVREKDETITLTDQVNGISMEIFRPRTTDTRHSNMVLRQDGMAEQSLSREGTALDKCVLQLPPSGHDNCAHARMGSQSRPIPAQGDVTHRQPSGRRSCFCESSDMTRRQIQMSNH